MSSAGKVEVTGADREAAWPFRPSCYKDNTLTREKWNDGVYDAVAPCIQAFARHRIATEADNLALLREAADRLEEASKALPVLRDMLKRVGLGKGADVAIAMLEANAATLATLTAAIARGGA